MIEKVYYTPKPFPGFIGILTIYKDGFLRFDLELQSGPVDTYPEFWDGGWILLGDL